MRFLPFKKALLAAAIIAECTFIATAHADPALEEVIVTARKREENLQQVPTAINVFTADSLKDRQVENIVDLQSATPNVTIAETSSLRAGATSIFIRGIGNDPSTDLGVGVYLDDVYLARGSGLNLDVFDIERIEVLKGPQGNLYGRNTTGGAIKYISKEPTDTVQASIEGKIGSNELRQVKTSASGPLIEDVLYGGVGLSYKKRDGNQTNLYDGKKYNGLDSQAVRANLKLEPIDSVTLKLFYNYTHDNPRPGVASRLAVDAQGLQTQYQNALAMGALPPGATSPDLSQATPPGKINTAFDFDSYRLLTETTAFSAEWRVDDALTLKSVTAKRTTDNTAPYDFSGTSDAYLQTLFYDQYDDVSQEFQFNYSGDTLDLVGGIFYFDGYNDSPGTSTISPRYPLPPASSPVGPVYLALDQIAITDSAEQKVKSLSYYINADFDLSDAWHASLGARYTTDRKSVEKEGHTEGTVYSYIPSLGPGAVFPCAYDAPASPGCPTGGPSGNNDIARERSRWSNFTPTFKLAYDIDEDTMAYASIASGFKAGGFVINTTLAQYDPEKVRTYALGLKTTLLDNRLRLNTEAFYNDYTDKQLSYTTFKDGALVLDVGNIGKAHTQGVDFEANWLTPLEGLQIDFNVGYLDAVMDEYIVPDLTAGAGSNATVDVADVNSLGFSPHWTTNLRATYSVPVAERGDLTISGNAAYRSRAFTNSPVDRSSPLGEIQEAPDYALFDASIAFRTADQHWRVALEGRNLADKRVLASTFLVAPFVDAGYTEPRSWALSVGYTY
jgi:iron complex outermembrane receptor protein